MRSLDGAAVFAATRIRTSARGLLDDYRGTANAIDVVQLLRLKRPGLTLPQAGCTLITFFDFSIQLRKNQ
jgi:hypothetical protein